MKKIVVIIALAVLSVNCFGRGFHHGGFHGRPPMIHHHMPPPHHHHHPYVGGVVAGAVLGGVIASTFAPAPTVIYNPPATYVPPARVWVPAHYENQYDAYGRIIGQIYIPGYWR